MIRTALVHESRLEEFLVQLRTIGEEAKNSGRIVKEEGDAINFDGVKIEIAGTSRGYYFLKIVGEDSKEDYIEKIVSRISGYKEAKR